MENKEPKRVTMPASTFAILEGSGVVISGVVSPQIWVVSVVTPIITLLITTREPPTIT